MGLLNTLLEASVVDQSNLVLKGLDMQHIHGAWVVSIRLHLEHDADLCIQLQNCCPQDTHVC